MVTIDKNAYGNGEKQPVCNFMFLFRYHIILKLVYAQPAVAAIEILIPPFLKSEKFDPETALKNLLKWALSVNPRV